jgi:O-antigen ligase
MWDTANQYVSVCENSGLLPFILFLAVIVYGFKYLGKVRRRTTTNARLAHFVWAVGAALFANVIAYFGISYFDQSIVPWYCLLAIISVVGTSHKRDSAQAQIEGSSDRVDLVPMAEAQLAR